MEQWSKLQRFLLSALVRKSLAFEWASSRDERRNDAVRRRRDALGTQGALRPRGGARPAGAPRDQDRVGGRKHCDQRQVRRSRAVCSPQGGGRHPTDARPEARAAPPGDDQSGGYQRRRARSPTA
eukprot:5961519-Prymnesium_polylepis.1